MCFKVDHLLMAGDIAFYAMGLGKVNMSGAWCWLCRLAKRQWQLPPIDALEPHQFVIPTLHTKLGLANKVWKDGFVPWIDSRVEDVPENVINARNNYLSADFKFRVSQDEVDEVTDVVGDLKAQQVAISTQLRERDANNQLVLRSRSSQRKDASERLGGSFNDRTN